MVTVLRFGVVESILQNVVYTLPPKAALLYTDASSPSIVLSTTEGLTSTTALTLDSNNQATVNAPFLELTSTGPINIFLKPYGV